MLNRGVCTSSQVNALPESASATINTRVESFSSIEQVGKVYSRIIDQVAKKYAFRFNGEAYGKGVVAGNITLTVQQADPPSPISPVYSVAFQTFARAVQASFGPDVISAPSTMTGNTDTRRYVRLRSIFSVVIDH